ncbi:bifunctional isocitrate dehydrogenase kinase/phosphatase [Hydromonas duriensis]|uniref:Isocitrate dehydrogenase kinase/phosphatase n=1 Tax=Hydromonas duriensis TaxID=1527608 RepID=A0A4R6Y3Q9_9BURK|nr:bifunctional isocitrate dehydrogenase kinase/phosphatase [Hydromonas duriensis]TDR31000.1 isocitrate dehydrogenase kinase/phosphatase [Hydromonas duriensis]
MTQHRPQTLANQILKGFDRHYARFRECARAAKIAFEQADWPQIQKLAAERIAFYDERVHDTATAIKQSGDFSKVDEAFWHSVKTEYVELLMNHHQPECAETFFNSVSTKVLDREYFNNDMLFVRPMISTEYIDSESATYSSYYPNRDGWQAALTAMFNDLGMHRPFTDLARDVQAIIARLSKSSNKIFEARPNLQIQAVRSLFYRNKGGYLLGKIINGHDNYPFAIPILHDAEGGLCADTILLDGRHLGSLFSFNRAYFMIDCEVPSALVQFLQTVLPQKPRAELYSMIGLQKHGKALFYRDFKHHQKHSTDDFILAPGIKGLVMLVFTLPSYPYVFKLIKDVISPPKEVDKELVEKKYQLVKKHDRVGRMADTLEFSNVAFPHARFTQELIDEITKLAPTEIAYEGDNVIIKHVYIERRMMPLNMYLQDASQRGDKSRKDNAVIEYGNAIKDMVAANIFPGDMLFKNFGVTRGGRVVFYDYDEIEYLTDCKFRPIPKRYDDEDDMGEVWYSVDKYDVFPEEFEKFLLTDPEVKQVFMRYHAELLDWKYWQSHQERIRAGHIEDFYPYPHHLRFVESGYTS